MMEDFSSLGFLLHFLLLVTATSATAAAPAAARVGSLTECWALSSCGACVAAPGCGFCAGECMAGTRSGSLDELDAGGRRCIAPRWSFGSCGAVRRPRRGRVTMLIALSACGLALVLMALVVGVHLQHTRCYRRQQRRAKSERARARRRGPTAHVERHVATAAPAASAGVEERSALIARQAHGSDDGGSDDSAA